MREFIFDIVCIGSIGIQPGFIDRIVFQVLCRAGVSTSGPGKFLFERGKTVILLRHLVCISLLFALR